MYDTGAEVNFLCERSRNGKEREWTGAMAWFDGREKALSGQAHDGI